jgi:hypothetical protein
MGNIIGQLMQNPFAGYNAALALIHAAEMVFKHKD